MPNDPPTKYIDLDGTLAYYNTWKGPTNIGKPIKSMVEKVKGWLDNGVKVVIFTTRLNTDGNDDPIEDRGEVEKAVKDWCKENLGQELEVTDKKGFFHQVYDDRAVGIVKNTGKTRDELMLTAINELKERGRADSSILKAVIEILKDAVKLQNN